MTSVKTIYPPASDFPPDKVDRDRPVLERIKIAAFDLFSEKGYDRITVEDIAHRAGISRRTYFRYCPTKAEALWADTGTRMHEFREYLRKAPRDRPITDTIMDAYLNIFRADVRFVRARLRLLRDTPMTAALRQTIYAGWEGIVAAYVASRTNEPADAMFPRTFAFCTIAAIRSAGLSWAAQDRDDNWPEFMAQAFRYLDHGFAMPEPVRKPD